MGERYREGMTQRGRLQWVLLILAVASAAAFVACRGGSDPAAIPAAARDAIASPTSTLPRLENSTTTPSPINAAPSPTATSAPGTGASAPVACPDLDQADVPPDRTTHIYVAVCDKDTQEPVAGAIVDVQPLGLRGTTDSNGTILFIDVPVPELGPPNDPTPTLVSVMTTADGYGGDLVLNYSLFPRASTWLLGVQLSRGEKRTRNFQGTPRAYWAPRGVGLAQTEIIEAVPGSP